MFLSIYSMLHKWLVDITMFVTVPSVKYIEQWVRDNNVTQYYSNSNKLKITIYCRASAELAAARRRVIAVTS